MLQELIQIKMKLSKLLFFCFILNSCITQEKCAERFPSKETDSVTTVVSYVHDTIYESFDEEVVEFDDVGFGLDTSLYYHREEKKGKQTAVLDIRKGKIKVTCKEDAYKDTIAFLRKQIETTEKKTKIAPAVVKYIDRPLYKPLLYYFGITLLLAVGFAAGKWFKVF